MIGRTIGHYRILDRLGEGGMGVVYRAEDTKLGRSVALKFLPPEVSRDVEARGRFEREARAASLLDHPNICTIYGVGEADSGQLYIAMAHYDGESLAARIAREVLSLDEAIHIVEQIARGLGKAHSSGIVHRDIKPANVMLTSEGVAKILDFGLAKLSGATGITRSHTSLGTIAYMTPEQIRGEKVGPQADIWALGVVFFELLTGKRPFRGEYTEAISYAILNEQPATITDLRPDLPPELDPILKRMLRKDPLQRYQTVSEVLSDLEPLKTPSSGSGARKRATERQKLRSGAKLGSYQIERPLGSGGMGDVYLAKDTRLDRQDAIKVLAPEFSEDAQLKQRFQREAKTISQLSHPNICTLFDVGEQEGVGYLVMEYLEGETLADRKGALPIPQVLKIGIQIAEGLAAAHRQGIVHRDLKPGNVMITKSGMVKLLDFGLAKEGGAIPMKTHGSDEKPLTAEGMIVGTLAYMAPEQIARGDADARTDIFALGAMLFELVTGKRAFEGDTKASLIASIIERDPAPIRSLQPAVPSILERMIHQCLEKDPDERWQTARDVALQLRGIADSGSHESMRLDTLAKRRQSWLLPAITGLMAGVLATTIAVKVMKPKRSTIGRSQLSIILPDDHPLAADIVNVFVAISPDGSKIVYSGKSPTGTQLFLRSLSSPVVTPIAGTEDGLSPFFSPNGTSIGFIANARVKTVSLVDGAIKEVGIAGGPGSGGTWLEDNSIVFSPLSGSPLQKMPAGGGKAESFTTIAPSEAGHTSPDAVPGGRFVLYSAEVEGKSFDEARIALLDLRTRKSRTLFEGGTHPRYTAGQIIFARQDRLFSVPFDAGKGQIIGKPSEIAAPVFIAYGTGYAGFDVADDGTIAYVPYGGTMFRNRLAWVDRSGKTDPLPLPPQVYIDPRISPNGKKLVVDIGGANDDLWVNDLTRGTFSRLTFNAENMIPVWTHDSSSVIFGHYRDTPPELFATRADGTGEPRKILASALPSFPLATSRDGKHVALMQFTPATRWDLLVMPLGGNGTPRAVVASRFNDQSLDFSPDGRWIVYMTDESGRNEIYVQPLDGAGEKTQISTDGGNEPAWSHSGREIFYRSGDRLMVVDVTSTAGFSASAPRVLFEHPFEHATIVQIRNYDVAPDDQRFIFVEPVTHDRDMRRVDVILK